MGMACQHYTHATRRHLRKSPLSIRSSSDCGVQAHSTENLYRTTGTAITRASDDFYPREPASHTVHLGVCAYNSLFIGPLLLPDWVRKKDVVLCELKCVYP